VAEESEGGGERFDGSEVVGEFLGAFEKSGTGGAMRGKAGPGVLLQGEEREGQRELRNEADGIIQSEMVYRSSSCESSERKR
jgi:hypothetical protein